MSLILISSERFAEHETPPGHPERPQRAEVMDVIAMKWREQGGEVVAPRLVTTEQLSRVHDREYLHRMSALSGKTAALDPDTFISPESHEIALLAAGAAVDAVERVMGGSAEKVLALVRPPGHHAERDRAMGFCLYNNVAVAAAHARALGAGRVAIVDYDVHHGNGTQHIFESDPDVLYVSTHQFPFYPGTGAVDEVGTGKGRGFTVNVPLESGATDEDYRLAWDEIVEPVLGQFKPDLLLVSAGFDAHERDPIASMRVTVGGFAAMTRRLRTLADECCGGRMVLVTEGGYDVRALAASLEAVVEALSSEASASEWPVSGGRPPTRGRAAVAAAKQALAPFWRL